jgi:predicted nucleic acid-binding protein
LAVSDASPLISLVQVDRLELLRAVFRDIAVPPAVAWEVAPSVGALPYWIREIEPGPIPDLPDPLGAGEREAIALAVRLSANRLVIDDLPGRRAAANQGLNVIGTLGLLVRARARGVIQAVRPEMDAVIANGLYVSDDLYWQILALAGEDVQ